MRWKERAFSGALAIVHVSCLQAVGRPFSQAQGTWGFHEVEMLQLLAATALLQPPQLRYKLSTPH